jgi:hypothetical protein
MNIISMTQLQFEKSDANLILRLAKFIGQLFCLVGMICHLHAAPNTHIQSNPINPKYPTKTVIKEATT